MSVVIASLIKAVRQLADPAVMRVAAKSIAITLLLFVMGGVGLYFGLVRAFARFGLDGGGFASAAAAVVIAIIAFWFWFRVVALAVLQFFADEIVAAVEAKHYPEAARTARKLPFRRDLANSVRGLSRAVGFNLLALPLAIVLMFTATGPAIVFLVVNAALLGRELTDMAWLRHCGDDPTNSPVAGFDRFVVGGSIAALMLVPFAGLLAPIIGAAAGTHVTHRAMKNKSDRALANA
ncbi:MAG: EI24 domain-containing protein [Pseudomonadota bacterium]